MILVYLAEHLIDEQINVAGTLDAVTEISMWVIALICSAWAILALGEVAVDAIVSSPRIRPKSVDASMVTILARVVSFGIAFWVVL